MPTLPPLGPWRCASRLESLDLASPVPLRPGEQGEVADVVAARLRHLGERVEDELRGAWARAKHAPDAADPDTAAMWRRWGEGRPFADRGRWLRLLDKPVVGAFRQALASRPLPPDVMARAVGDLRDALFYQLVGAEGGSGFGELATYALETAPGGPVAPLVGVLSPRSRSTVAACMVRRGHWPRTVELALPDLAYARDRAVRLVSEDDAESWIDLHTVVRLLDSWRADPMDDERDWTVITQNHGRARGRLRAVAAREPPADLAAAVAVLPACAERTRAAARRWAWTWAWEALAVGFSFDFGRPVIRPCVGDPGPEPLDGDDLEVLDTWLLLAILRGRGETVRRWSVDGSGDPDGTWGRLVGLVPTELREADGGLARVRAALAQRWDERVAGLLPTLREVAAIAVGRDAKRAFWAAVGPTWHPAVARPASGFPTFVASARSWVHGSESGGPLPLADEEST